MTQNPAIPPNAGIVRYQVSNVERSVAFYVEQLGFNLLLKGGPAFASVSRGNLTLLLSGPGSSGARPLPDGRGQEPGGFNRIVLQVSDLALEVETLKRTAVRFRNEVEVGPGGKQIRKRSPTESSRRVD